MALIELTRKELEALPCLHRGESSLLYLQERSPYGRPVVIKILSSGSPRAVEKERLANEYELTSELRIPGIRGACDSISVAGVPALVLDYLPGTALRDIPAGSLSPATAVAVAACLARSLEQLHRRGIIHCNIGSSSIIVAPDRREAFLIDLGRARRAGAPPPRGDVAALPEGALPYLAPEMTGRINLPVDHRSDLYSLGAVLYQMLAGRPPFEAATAAEMLHCHIALCPPPPAELVPGLPLPLSDLVMKLLAKSPEDRYQSAHGVRADLERCLALLERGEGMEPFPLGGEDFREVPRPPEAVQGRGDARELLREAFSRACGGQGSLVVVSGEAGIGKTALVNGMRREVTSAGGYFIRGGFDEFRANVPYHALIEAFTELIDLILVESAERLQWWRERFAAALAEDAALLVEVLPHLELVLGSRPERRLHLAEVRGRFPYVFQRFVMEVAGEGRPLVLFLDNLQWADPASLELLPLLSAGVPHLLVAGAYRTGEAGDGQPLEAALEESQRRGAQLSRIELGNLSREGVGLLVADMLGCEPVQVASLGEIVQLKTGGNPLFAIQFLQSLYAQRLVFFSPDQNRWQWDAEGIGALEITDNVVALMSRKLEQLPPASREALAAAALLGSRFSTLELAEVMARPQGEILELLAPALELGLLLPEPPRGGTAPADSGGQPPRLEFLHDRVRRQAPASLPRKTRRLLHLAVGRLRLARMPKGELADRVFDVVDHLNEGFPYLDGKQEIERLMQMNLIAGRRAKRAAAYQAAIRYLSMGIGMLPADKWRSRYKLALELYLEGVEAEYLSGNHERAELLSGELLLHVSDDLVKARVHELNLLSLTARNLPLPAIKAGLQALDLLGLVLPRDGEGVELFAERIWCELAAEPEAAGERGGFPALHDPRQLAVMRVLMNLTGPAHQADQRLLGAVVLKMAQLSERHGDSPLAAFAFGWYAVQLCGRYDQPQRGERYGRLSLELLERCRAVELEARTLFLYNAFVRHWHEDARQALMPLREVRRKGTESGDLHYAYYGAAHYLSHLFCTGASLDVVSDRLAECLEAVDRQHLEFHGDFLRIWEELICALAGSGPAADERWRELPPAWLEQNQRVLIFARLSCRTVLCYLFGDFAGAVESASLAEEFESGGEGTLYLALFKCFQALALLADATGGGAELRRRHLERVAVIRERVRGWAEIAPVNFRHRLDLIDAEAARLEGDFSLCAERLGSAMRGAREAGLVQDEALAYELEAGCRIAMGRDDLAGHCVRKAVDGFRLWGAAAKARELEQRFRHLLVSEQVASFDTLAILTASHALSQELRLEQLLDKMMRIVIQNAGAQRGALIECKEGRLSVRAKGVIGQERVILQETPVEQSGDLPLSVLNFVVRTETPVLLSDASRDSAYSGDGYLARGGVKSLLCLPIVHQGKLSGLLYLENNLASCVFTPDSLEMLKILASQSAISMENARLYSDLQQENAERRRAEQEVTERMRQAGLAAEVGVALTTEEQLRRMLQRCTQALVNHLEVAFARIWVLNREADVLELQASAGMYTHLDGPHGRIPVGRMKVGMIARDRKVKLTNSLLGDPEISDQEWVRREGVSAFAGHPLVVADQLVGVMAVFSRAPLNDSTVEALAAVADEIALGIVRKQTEDALNEHRNYLEELVERRTAELSETNELLRDEIAERALIEEALNRRLLALIQPLEALEVEVSFADLFDLEEIQKIQDAFAEANNVASLITAPDGTPITKPSNFCRLCLEVIRSTERGLHDCFCSDAGMVQGETQGPVIRLCESGGLWNAGAGITLGGRHVANWIIGQVRNEEVDEERMYRYGEEIGVDAAGLREAFREVPVMSTEQFGKVAKVLFLLARELSLKAYQNYQQARFIVERKRAEEELTGYREHLEELVRERTAALRDSEKRLWDIINFLPDATFAVNLKGEITLWNSTAEKMTGVSAAEMMGKGDREYGLAFYGERRAALIDLVLGAPPDTAKLYPFVKMENGMVYGEGIIRTVHHPEAYAMGIAAPLYDSEGDLAGAIESVRDITEHKKLEEQLRQAQKMEAIGSLAGGVAHDFNNILTAIIGYATMLKLGLGEEHPMAGYTGNILTASQTAADLTKSLLAFSRKQVLAAKPEHLNDIVRKIDTFLLRIIGEDVEFKVETCDRDLVVMADPTQIEQVLMNLAVNARDAMPEGGTLSISTTSIEIAPEAGDSFLQPGGYAVITVSDTGYGMDEKTRQRIFEPFFTTKAVGKGTGLGLSIVYGIVKQHGGEIQVFSEPGKGTTFKIYLGLVEKKEEGKGEAALPAAVGGTGTILFAEDNEEVRTLMSHVLEEYGYTVIEAVDGEDAVAKFAANMDRIELIISDIVMPKKDGRTAYDEMEEIRAGVPVLFTSGYAAGFTGRKKEGEREPSPWMHFIPKPITPQCLLAKVRELLTTPSAPS